MTKRKGFEVGDRVEIKNGKSDPRQRFGVIVAPYGFAGDRVEVVTENGSKWNVEVKHLIRKGI